MALMLAVARSIVQSAVALEAHLAVSAHLPCHRAADGDNHEGHRRVGDDRLGQTLVRRKPGQHERDALAEAVAWVKKCPNPMPGPSEIEIRPFYAAADVAEFMTPEELSAPRDGERGKLGVA